MAYSREFIEEIKARNSIEEVVGRVVQLKRSGSRLMGSCPFHSERTPSFCVFTDTSSYYCFGCGAGGDVVTFVMQTEGLDYREAVEELAKRAGIDVPDDPSVHTNSQPTVKRDRMYDINREAARYFYKALLSPEGAHAREYLQKRRFSSTTIKRFGIGYSPGGYNAPLCSYLIAKGFTPFEIRTAFLGGEGKNGRLYDMFRNRVVFPIFDVNGEVCAFSARRLNEEDERKYINTNDTPVFKKSKVLFGMNIAKNSKEGSIIMCEGAPDCIAMHQAGFDNAAATLGTAITSEHARLIAKYTKKVFLAYDIDAAGRRATMKGIDLLNQVGVDTKIIDLGTDTKDPDEFIKKYGADAFRAKLKGSTGQIDYKIETIVSSHDITVAEDKLRAVNEVAAFIATIASRPEREIYSSRAAELLGISFEAMRTEAERLAKSVQRRSHKDEIKKALDEQSGLGATANSDKLRFSSEASHEEAVLGILLIRPDLGPSAAKELQPEDFATALNKKIYGLFAEDLAEGREADVSKDGALTAREAGALEGYRAARLQLGDNTEAALMSHIKALKEFRTSRDYEKKIKESPADALGEYIDSIKKKKNSDNKGDNNGTGS